MIIINEQHSNRPSMQMGKSDLAKAKSRYDKAMKKLSKARSDHAKMMNKQNRKNTRVDKGNDFVSQGGIQSIFASTANAVTSIFKPIP